MKQRTITAFVFAAIMIGGIYWNRMSFQILFTMIAAGMLWEFFGLVFPENEPKRVQRRVIGCVIGVLPVLWMGIGSRESLINNGDLPLLFSGPLYQAGFLIFLISILVMLIFLWELFQQHLSPAAVVGNYLLGIFYISLPVILLFTLATPFATYYPNRVFGLLWLIWTNDVFAYLIGSQFGKNKLHETISPNKTWEGTIGGAICAVLMAWGLSNWFDDYSPAEWIVLGFVVALIATPGDLVESMLKRHAGVKDSGNLLPGHGGLLDRFDSLIFVLPFALLAIVLLGV